MKAAGEVVPQTLSSALTCFLPGLLTLPGFHRIGEYPFNH
jgi:hypothetical protein